LENDEEHHARKENAETKWFAVDVMSYDRSILVVDCVYSQIATQTTFTP